MQLPADILPHRHAEVALCKALLSNPMATPMHQKQLHGRYVLSQSNVWGTTDAFCRGMQVTDRSA